MKSRFFLRLALSCALFFSALVLEASQLSLPIDLQSADVLSPGQFEIQFESLGTDFENEYDDNGIETSRSHSLNHTIFLKDLVDMAPSEEERKLRLASVTESGLELTDIAGQVSGSLRVQTDYLFQKVSYGLSEMWTTSLAAPILRTKTQMTLKYKRTRQSALFISALNSPSGRETTGRAGLRDPFQAQLSQMGYKSLENSERTELGDLSWLNRYQLWADNELKVSVSQLLTLPTGRTLDVDRVADIAPGDGQIDVGAGVIVDLKPWKFPLSFTLGSSYVSQLPSTVERRIPLSRRSRISPDVDSETDLNPGDILHMQFGARFRLLEGLNLTSSFSMQSKYEDQYSGTKYERHRYELLEERTFQQMDTAQVGFEYSYEIIGMALSYSEVIHGRNVPIGSQTNMSIKLVF